MTATDSDTGHLTALHLARKAANKWRVYSFKWQSVEVQMHVAEIEAQIATAEALTRIADALDPNGRER